MLFSSAAYESDFHHSWRSKDSDAAGSNFMAAQLLGNASLQVDLHVSFGRCDMIWT